MTFKQNSVPSISLGTQTDNYQIYASGDDKDSQNYERRQQVERRETNAQLTAETAQANGIEFITPIDVALPSSEPSKSKYCTCGRLQDPSLP